MKQGLTVAADILRKAYDSVDLKDGQRSQAGQKGQQHPTTAEVMRHFDGMQLGKAGVQVLKTLLAVARRNSDGRWFATMQRYEQELVDEDSQSVSS